jgi:hypothetical protein
MVVGLAQQVPQGVGHNGAVKLMTLLLLTLMACGDRKLPEPAKKTVAPPPGELFSDPEGRYTIRFPAAPKVDKNVGQGELGAVAQVMARLPLDAGIFTAMTATYPVPRDTAINLEALMRVARDQVLVEVRGHTTGEQRIDHDGLVGETFDFAGTIEDEPVIGHAVVYAAADPATVRVASVFGEPARLDEPAARAFLASFSPAPPLP